MNHTLEMYAGFALMGLLSRGVGLDTVDPAANVSMQAFKIAQAMCAELERLRMEDDLLRGGKP
jgi:hypothetical protein